MWANGYAVTTPPARSARARRVRRVPARRTNRTPLAGAACFPLAPPAPPRNPLPAILNGSPPDSGLGGPKWEAVRSPAGWPGRAGARLRGDWRMYCRSVATQPAAALGPLRGGRSLRSLAAARPHAACGCSRGARGGRSVATLPVPLPPAPQRSAPRGSGSLPPVAPRPAPGLAAGLSAPPPRGQGGFAGTLRPRTPDPAPGRPPYSGLPPAYPRRPPGVASQPGVGGAYTPPAWDSRSTLAAAGHKPARRGT